MFTRPGVSFAKSRSAYDYRYEVIGYISRGRLAGGRSRVNHRQALPAIMAHGDISRSSARYGANTTRLNTSAAKLYWVRIISRCLVTTGGQDVELTRSQLTPSREAPVLDLGVVITASTCCLCCRSKKKLQPKTKKNII